LAFVLPRLGLIVGIAPLLTGKPLKLGGAMQRRGSWHTPGPKQQIALRIIFRGASAWGGWGPRNEAQVGDDPPPSPWGSGYDQLCTN
jgi:hypothetical protein